MIFFRTTLSPNVSNPDYTCFMLKDRSLQPIAQALNMPLAVETRPTSAARVKTPIAIPMQCDNPLPSLNTAEGSSKSNNATSKALKREQLNRYAQAFFIYYVRLTNFHCFI